MIQWHTLNSDILTLPADGSSGRRHVEPGEVVVAPACGTPYKAVAHAVAVDAFYDTSAEVIRRAYELALDQLAATGCRTIAALGCGYGRCPVAAFIKAITPLFKRSLTGIDSVTLATTNEDLATAISAVLPSRIS
jgi:O-acetyl-ADP-ribose deacetylase